MTEIKKYIEARKDYRLVAAYSGRKPVYIHGEVSLNEALEAFEAIGKPDFIQECVKGKRRTVWDRLAGWSPLEKLINNL